MYLETNTANEKIIFKSATYRAMLKIAHMFRDAKYVIKV